MNWLQVFKKKVKRSAAAKAAAAAGAAPAAVPPAASSPLADGGGYLEWARCAQADNSVVVSGWVSVGEHSQAWLDIGGRRHPLEEAFRYRRGDLEASEHAVLGPVRGAVAAFFLSAPDAPVGTPVRLMMRRGAEVLRLSETKVTPLPLNPLTAFGELLKYHSGRFAERFAQVDSRVMQALIDQQARWSAAQATETAVVGVLPAQPLVSIVIPLFKRIDFVEPQLMKFSRDPWLMQHAELIYVVDDPALADTLRQQAPDWVALYGVPFRWVWGQVNRGFSGANNLGVSVARAQKFIFLNSDVFPVEPGWAQALCAALDERPELGAVAPRLLHADGTVQHVGMAFEYLPGLGIWSNQHPFKGLPDALVPERGLEEVPAVTGACLAMRRADFERVGGWNTGYLIGDFEDSDLCLSLRQLGLGSACLHSVRLVHLERQSFRLSGENGLRMQVVILNAVRHQKRWGPVLAELAGAGSASAAIGVAAAGAGVTEVHT